MMILFTGFEVYAPEPLGRKDVLVAAGKVLAVADRLEADDGVRRLVGRFVRGES